MTQLEVLQWLELINIRQAKNDFNVADIPMSVLLELRRRKFANDGSVITDEGIQFLEKHKIEQ
jgi:hypothetical protein